MKIGQERRYLAYATYQMISFTHCRVDDLDAACRDPIGAVALIEAAEDVDRGEGRGPRPGVKAYPLHGQAVDDDGGPAACRHVADCQAVASGSVGDAKVVEPDLARVVVRRADAADHDGVRVRAFCE